MPDTPMESRAPTHEERIERLLKDHRTRRSLAEKYLEMKKHESKRKNHWLNQFSKAEDRNERLEDTIADFKRTIAHHEDAIETQAMLTNMLYEQRRKTIGTPSELKTLKV